MKLLLFTLLLAVSSIKESYGVVGGDEVRPHSAPYQVAVMYDHFGLSAGGSILDPTHILTSADFCINMDVLPVYYILAGIQNMRNPGPTKQMRHISNKTMHPSFDRNGYKNNICILKLSTPLTFNKFVSAVTLPKNDKTEYKDTALLTGWGYTSYNPDLPGPFPDLLQGATLPLDNDISCKKSFKNIDETKQFCAGTPKLTSCTGDYGGPLICTTSTGGKEQCGIASYYSVDYSMFECNKMSLYTKVGPYLDWIQEQLKH